MTNRAVRPGPWIGPALAWLALVAPPLVHGELLYFRAGGRLQAPARTEQGRVRIETPRGPVTFREGDFTRIVPGFNPSAEWAARQSAALAGGPADRRAAAWWALESGLVDEAVDMLRQAGTIDTNDPAAQRLSDLVERLQRPLPDPAPTDRPNTLGAAFREARGPHLLLWHQRTPDEADARLRALERIVSAYYLVFAFHGRELKLPSERLTSVYFDDREDYVRFLDSQSAGAFRNTQGYYHPILRLVVAYDASSVEARQAASPIDPRPGETGTRLADDSKRRALLRDELDTARDLGTASHEMVHQLAYASGLDTEPRRLPCWFHEGLAAQFEVYRGGRWAGFGRAHDLRLRDWRSMARTPSVGWIASDAGFGRGYDGEVYAASWALVNFLMRSRPEGLLTYVDLLRNPADSVERKPSDRFVEVLRMAVGDDLEALSSEWRAATSGLETPLEANAPR